MTYVYLALCVGVNVAFAHIAFHTNQWVKQIEMYTDKIKIMIVVAVLTIAGALASMSTYYLLSSI